jgi:hypothetical protein
MNNDINNLQHLLEQATAAGEESADNLDPETAQLREAWLAFGQMLDAATPPAALSTDHWKTPPPAQLRYWRLPAVGLLAASLLIAVAAISMLRDTKPAVSTGPATVTTAANNPRAVSPKTHTQAKQTKSASDEPQWDDSFDDQVAQVSWDMTCARQNQLFRTDSFGIIEYQLEQASQAIQADSL